MSELVLQESSDINDSSSDDELNLIKKEASNFNFKKMIKSNERVDKRLLEQYLIKQSHRMGFPLSYKELSDSKVDASIQIEEKKE